MMRVLLFSSALALSGGLAALAQTPASQPVNPPPGAEAPSAADASAKATMFKPGMLVKDSSGATIGAITKADKAGEVTVNVDGKSVNVATSALSLSPSGDSAVSTKSKAQLKAAAPSS